MDSLAFLQRIDPATVPGSGKFYAGAAALFAFGGLSFDVSRRLAAQARALVPPEAADDSLYERAMSFTYRVLEGDWADEHEIEPALIQESLRNGQLWGPTTYLGLLGEKRLHRGEFAAAHACIEEIDRIWDLFQYDLAKTNHYYLHTLVPLERAELPAAIEAADAYYDENPEDLLHILALGAKAKAQTELGELDAAEETLRRAAEVVARSSPVPPFHVSSYHRSRFLLDVARLAAAVESGDRAAVREWTRRARPSARAALRSASKVAWRRTEVLRLAARYHALRGRRRRAQHLLDRSAALGERLGAVPETARTYAEAARLLRAGGRGDERFRGLDAAACAARARAAFELLELAWISSSSVSRARDARSARRRKAPVVLGAVLTLVSAALYALAFPPVSARALAWIALVPFLVALRGAAPRRRLALGALWTLAVGWAVGTWMPGAVSGYFQQPLSIGIALFLIVTGAMAAPYYVAFAVAYPRLVRGRGAAAPFLAAAAWAGAELLRGRLLNGTLLYVGNSPWATFGYSQAGVGAAVQIASVTGVYGVSFVLASVNAAVAEVLWRQLGARRRARAGEVDDPGGARAARTGLGLALAAAVLVLAGGALVLRQAPARAIAAGRATPAGRAGRDRRPDAAAARGDRGVARRDGWPTRVGRVAVALAQANLGPAARWGSEGAARTLDAYLRLTRDAFARDDPEIVFWPEAALTFFLEQDALYGPAVAAAVRDRDAELVVGAPRAAGPDGTAPFTNSVYLVTAGGELTARYDKRYLLPFMEYFPLRLELARRRFGRVREFTPGAPSPPLATRAGKAGILVCNEALLPQFAAERMREGADYLVNPSNDSWVAHAGFAEQQFDIVIVSRRRATELRRPRLRLRPVRRHRSLRPRPGADGAAHPRRRHRRDRPGGRPFRVPAARRCLRRGVSRRRRARPHPAQATARRPRMSFVRGDLSQPSPAIRRSRPSAPLLETAAAPQIASPASVRRATFDAGAKRDDLCQRARPRPFCRDRRRRGGRGGRAIRPSRAHSAGGPDARGHSHGRAAADDAGDSRRDRRPCRRPDGAGATTCRARRPREAALVSLVDVLKAIASAVDAESFSVIGAVARNAWAPPRATTDLDVTITARPATLTAVGDCLGALGYRTVRRQQVDPSDELPDIVIFRAEDADPRQVDLLLAKTPFEEEVLRRSVAVDIASHRVRVASPEDLVVYKLLADRPRDREDIRAVLRRRAPVIDRDPGGVRPVATLRSTRAAPA